MTLGKVDKQNCNKGGDGKSRRPHNHFTAGKTGFNPDRAHKNDRGHLGQKQNKGAV